MLELGHVLYREPARTQLILRVLQHIFLFFFSLSSFQFNKIMIIWGLTEPIFVMRKHITVIIGALTLLLHYSTDIIKKNGSVSVNIYARSVSVWLRRVLRDSHRSLAMETDTKKTIFIYSIGKEILLFNNSEAQKENIIETINEPERRMTSPVHKMKNVCTTHAYSHIIALAWVFQTNGARATTKLNKRKTKKNIVE